MRAPAHVPVAILGAGLTGLSAALACQRAGLRYRLYEKDTVTGGLAQTLLDEGYRFDRTGHLLHVRDAALKNEVLSRLGKSARQLTRASVVWSHGIYTEYPFQVHTHGLPPQVVHECVMGFFRAQLEGQQREPKNFEEYCEANFGSGFSKHFMLPYNSRLWGVPAREITSEWCKRFVPLPSLEQVVGGALGLRQPSLGYNSQFIYPELGMGQLPQRLTEEVSGLELGKAPRAIDYANKVLSFEGESTSYDHLVSSIPLDRLLRLCGALPAAVESALGRLRCTRLYYLDIALNGACRQPWHWAYVPEAHYPFYRVGCYTNFSDRLAPKGSGSLYVELVQRAPPSLDQLMPQVIRALSEMRVIRGPGDVRFVRVRRIDHAYVIFDHAHRGATTTVQDFLSEHAIRSAGRYGEWTYSSMEDALLSGQRAVDVIAHDG